MDPPEPADGPRPADQAFSRQMAKLRAAAKVTQASQGTRSPAALALTRSKASRVTRMAARSKSISPKMPGNRRAKMIPLRVRFMASGSVRSEGGRAIPARRVDRPLPPPSRFLKRSALHFAPSLDASRWSSLSISTAASTSISPEPSAHRALTTS